MDGVNKASIDLLLFSGCSADRRPRDFSFALEDTDSYDYQIQFRNSAGADIVCLTRTVSHPDKKRPVIKESYTYDLSSGHLETPASSSDFLLFMATLKMHLFRYGFRQKYGSGNTSNAPVESWWKRLGLEDVLDKTINDYLVFFHLAPLPELSAHSTLGLVPAPHEFPSLSETLNIIPAGLGDAGPSVVWQYSKSSSQTFEIKTEKKVDRLLGLIPLGTELRLYEPDPRAKEPCTSGPGSDGMERAALMVMKDCECFLRQALSAGEPADPSKVREILIIYKWAALVIGL